MTQAQQQELLTETEFNTLIQFTRIRSESMIKALRSIFIDGQTPSFSAEQHNVSLSLISRRSKVFRETRRKIQDVSKRLEDSGYSINGQLTPAQLFALLELTNIESPAIIAAMMAAYTEDSNIKSPVERYNQQLQKASKSFDATRQLVNQYLSFKNQAKAGIIE